MTVKTLGISNAQVKELADRDDAVGAIFQKVLNQIDGRTFRGFPMGAEIVIRPENYKISVEVE